MSRVTIVLKTNEGGMWVLPQIAELVRRGHEVTTVLPRGDGRLRRALDAAGHAVVDIAFDFSFRPGMPLLRGLARLRSALRETAPDVVLYHLYASALATRIASLGLDVPRVHMVAGPLYLESRPIRLVERALHRRDTHLIAGSAYTARAYRAIGRPARTMSTIPYGVDLERFRPGDRGARESLGIPATAFVAIMVAYVYAPKQSVFPGVGVKGHEVLLDAWERHAASHPESVLLLVGSGFDESGEAHRAELRHRYGRRLGASVRWLGSVEDVRPLYASADVSVSPSLSENHGAALEASAMALPSIVSDAGGLPETVTDASGWVTPAGDVDALVAAIGDAEDAARSGRLAAMGAAARRHVEARFGVDASARRVADVLEDAVRRTPTALVVTEQRCWADAHGNVTGRKVLQTAASMPGPYVCTVAARATTPEEGGVPLLPGARRGLLLPWPTGARDALPALRGLRELWGAVGGSDAVLVFCPGVLGSIAGLMALARRRPVVTAVVGDPAQSLAPDVVGPVGSAVARPAVTATMRLLCRRAAVSRYVTERTLQRAYPPGAGTVVIAGTDAGEIPFEDPRPVRDGRLVMLTVAALDRPYKGIRELIDATATLVAAGHDVELVVVGSGRLRQELEELGERTVPGRVRFPGHVDAAALRRHYREADLFVLASWTEGLPRVLVEAMAAGLPCVATAVGGVPELLEEERLCRPRDVASLVAAIARLLSDDEGRRASSERNVEHARELLVRAAQAEVDLAAALHGLSRRLR